jgi:hypothetical protein
MQHFVALTALVTIARAEPANAQQIKAGVLTCDVSEGMGYILPALQQPMKLVHTIPPLGPSWPTLPAFYCAPCHAETEQERAE